MAQNWLNMFDPEVGVSIQSMTADITYLHSEEQMAGCRIRLHQLQDATQNNFLLVSARAPVNPLDYVEETYWGITHFLSKYDIDIADVDVYLDLLECNGLRSKHLYHWYFSCEDGILDDKIIEVNLDELPVGIKEKWLDYYQNHLGLFLRRSGLSISEKVEIFATALAESCYSDRTVENVQLWLKQCLLESIANQSEISSKFIK